MKYQKISTQKLNKIFLCFCENVTATACAKIVGVNRNTVNLYYNRIRELIFEQSLKEAGKEFGEFECDESYFGAKRIRGKRGGEDAGIRISEAWGEGVRDGRAGLLAGDLNADNTRTYAVRLDDIHSRSSTVALPPPLCYT